MVIEKKLVVESGSMHFCNVKDLKKHGAGSFKEKGILITLEKGKYEITIFLPNTWDGKIEIKKIVNVKIKSKFYIGDLCFCFSPDIWGTFLGYTNYILAPEYTEICTGGDGNFDTKVTIKELH